MLDQNTDRSSWAMVSLVAAGIILGIVKVSTSDIGNLVVSNIKALFAG
ncbi:hypothetical protein [Cytobacillus kochii]|nr:hypothetical protein [Cytobacillus kochii]